MKYIKKMILRIVILIIVINISQNVYSQEYYDKKTYFDPDSLSIVFFEAHGCLTVDYSFLTVNFNNTSSKIFTYRLCCSGEELYNIEETRYLRKGYLNKTDANLFIDLIFDNKIHLLPMDQVNKTQNQVIGTGDGWGKCAVFIKKDGNYFSKIIKYPGVDYRILNKEFVDFKRETFLKAIKLTKDIPLKELEDIIFNPSDSNFPIMELVNIHGDSESYLLMTKNNAQRFAAQTIGYLNDTSLIDDLISLYKKISLTDDPAELCWPLMQVFKKMDDDKITHFLGSIIEELIESKIDTFNLTMCSYGIIEAIASKSNVPLKTYYLKRCLLLSNPYLKDNAAKELEKLK